ncbi:hypothetical protein DMR_36360 [Solidesulfovibrio magneticus RS-1]|uniref:Uncharacterized protein n=1 Tax=Solidesulfovibrio magneticus (strain ATCC 700980 / DSM 13731 / RS-1) TaxID=573370 RepID=C4XLZ9_SOLM1|nr:hypothetical protein DMR_36360 [Solidesulfovibrio magneticus RS-1]
MTAAMGGSLLTAVVNRNCGIRVSLDSAQADQANQQRRSISVPNASKYFFLGILKNVNNQWIFY